MIIDKIELVDFRNYDELSLEFTDKTNIIYGKNAQGKTNIIEAIYMCATSKSHRGAKDKDIIKFQKDEAHIKINVLKNNIPFRIDIHLKKNKSKGIAINGLKIKKAAELFGILNAVVFSPEDLEIIKGAPQIRRRFIDMELCQIDKIYVNNLVNYNKALDNRNKLLKDIYNDKELEATLDIWDMQIVKFGKEIIKARKFFIDKLNEIVKEIHSNITDGKEELVIEYDFCVDENDFEKELVNSRQRDKKLKTTNIGPHRDDISFFVKGNNMKIFGSQGQQRTCALSLKLSELKLIEMMTGDKPVLLLDDVLSELDSDRQEMLLDNLKSIQTFITCTGIDEFVNKRFKIDKLFKIENGKVLEGESS